MIKFIGAILIITASSAIGLYYSSLVQSRVEELKSLRKAIYMLKGDIRYSGTPLPEAIDSLSQKVDISLAPFFSYISDELKKMEGRTFAGIWASGVKGELKNSCFSKRDKTYLIQFGESMGYLDKETQMNTMDLYIAQLEAEIDEMVLLAKEKTRLYNLLGVMGGIFLTIILI